MSALVVVMACPGREDMTRATLQALDGVGGAWTLPDGASPPIVWWTGLADPPLTPPGWIVFHNDHPPRGHRRDLWDLMKFAAIDPATDLVLFEDDVVPCRNAVPYIVDYKAERLTSFCNLTGPPRNGKVGTWPARGFHGTMALKFPAALLTRLVAAGHDSKHVAHDLHNGDTRIAHLLIEWGELVEHHRSLVQHVGEQSIVRPGVTLRGRHATADDFVPELDALTLGCTS